MNQSLVFILQVHTMTTYYNIIIQWKNEADSCQFHGLPSSPALNSTGCHDGVDFSLCFEDSAILYVISVVFLAVAGFSFFCGNSQRPKLPVGLLHSFKLVSGSYSMYILYYKSCSCTQLDTM